MGSGRSTLAGLILVAGVAAAICPTQAAQETPTSLDGAKVVSAEEVKTLQGQGAKVFDLRKKAAYVERHIVGAAHLSYEEKSVNAATFDLKADQMDLSKLPADKNALVVFHGHGPDGWKGYKASAQAVKAGYRRVHFFRGGFAEWTTKGLPTE